MKRLAVFIMFLLSPLFLFPQEANYDESKVPKYVLPELLKLKNGREVKTNREWMEKRRPEILTDFETQMYGRVPGKLEAADVKVVEESHDAFGGKATRKQVRLTFRKGGRELNVMVLLYIPNKAQPVPLFLGLNFDGNQAVCNDPKILLTDSWIENDASLGITNHHVSEKSRGAHTGRWCVEKLLDNGFGLATAYYGRIRFFIKQAR